MYTTYVKIQIERYLDREEEEVGTGRYVYNMKQTKRDNQIESCLQHITKNREIIRQRDVYNIRHYLDREILRQRGGGGRYWQMYTTYYNRQIESYLDRGEEQEEVGTGRCIEHVTMD